MVAMAAMATAQTTPVQGRAGVSGSVSVDSLDAASSEPSGAQGATDAPAREAAEALTSRRPSDSSSSVNEEVVKVKLGNVSASASKEDIDDEEAELEEELETEKPRSNAWAAKKTVAQGMMDIALLTSNANQLRYLIMYGKHSSTYVISIVLIAISLLLQVAVGIVLIFKGKSDLKGEEKRAHANKLNNYVVVGVFLVTIINVFAASFSDISTPVTPASSVVSS